MNSDLCVDWRMGSSPPRIVVSICAADMADEVTEDEAKAFYERGPEVRFQASQKLRSERPLNVYALKRSGGDVHCAVQCDVYTDRREARHVQHLWPRITYMMWQTLTSTARSTTT